ncbi:MAG: 4-hydroxy-3-methylbut-2-enyl diphosphate reductase, partial [Lachnospiraceae bacterium]
MEIKIAKTAGFCFGVKRAVDKVYQQVEQHQAKPIYTFGPIIHNEEVIKDMRSKGVNILNDEKELYALTDGIIIIRSHGVPKKIYDILEQKGLTYVDATCPFVKKIHLAVKKESEKGRHIIIIGNETHPEVEGIKGWSTSPVTVIQTKEDAEIFADYIRKHKLDKISIVSQTTFNYNKFKDLVEIIIETGYDVSVLNTICSATKERQSEAKSIARGVDAMIVIGDKHSSNTQKLFEICKTACNNTYYIQTLDDLDMNQ